MATVTQYTPTCQVCGSLGDYSDPADAQSVAQDHDGDPSYAGHQSKVIPAQYDDGMGGPDPGTGDPAGYDQSEQDPEAYQPAGYAAQPYQDDTEHDQTVDVDARG